MLDLQSYLRGKGRNVPLKKGRLDLTSYMLGKSASGGIQEISGTLPLTVRSRVSQVLKNYIIYGTASGAGVETENLFDSTKQISSEGFWNNTGGFVSSSGWYGTLLIDVEPSTEYSFNPNSTTGASAKHLFYDENNNLIGNIPSGRQTFTTPANCVTMRFSYRSSSSNIMLTKSSTAPSSYIPYGYKLPLKVTADGTTTDYPVYIGDSQLGEGEYVDYEEQKIYKRGENEFPFAEEGTFTFGNGSVISDGAGTFIINTENNDTNVPSELIPLTTPYTVPQTNGEYTFYLGNTSTNSGLLIVFYDSERNLVDDWMYNYTWRKESSIPLMVGKTIAYVGFRINTNYSGSADMSVTPMISKNNNLTAYVPYIQPTDPPVPLPDIALPQGTVTIDIEGELKPKAMLKGKIEPI